jgi:hypothetical protein
VTNRMARRSVARQSKFRVACAVAVCTVAIGAAACVPPIRMNFEPLRSSAVGSPARSGAANVSRDGEPASVVVRTYALSPTVSVLGWDVENADYGLRATVRRDGSLVRDHQLFVSTYYFVDLREFFGAQWELSTTALADPQRLEYLGISRDVHSCEGDYGCSPYTIMSARIPDSLLRADHDDVSINVRGRNGTDELLTLRRDVIDRYLQRVDSVSAKLRRM